MFELVPSTPVCKSNASDVYIFFLMRLEEAQKGYNTPAPIRSIKPLAIKYPWLFDKLDEAKKLMRKEYIKHQKPNMVYFYYLDLKGNRVGRVNECRKIK
jgi:hypothetical protein